MRQRPGRPNVTTKAELERVALALFAEHGFEATTVDDIAAAAGIARRTFFRYFQSKNDVVWGDFDALLSAMRAWLDDQPPEVSTFDALASAVVRFNSLPPDAVPAHRQRMTLILRVPALQAHSTLRYAAWREVVASFVARRTTPGPVPSRLPRLLGHLCLATAVASYEAWLDDPDADLARLLAAGFEDLGAGALQRLG
jgi:mycofactocin system transcriptional regulator